MKLIEYAKLWDNMDMCIDTSDTVFDAIVTIDIDSDVEKNLDRPYWQFVKIILENVELVKLFNGAYASAICDYTGFVKANMKALKKFSAEEWYPESHNVDEDDYIYNWITEIHGYLAGYASDRQYSKFVKCFTVR